MHKYIYSYLSIFLFIGISISLVAQNKQGNIVEYFGKEKVETINEGDVIHVFKEGLIMRKNRIGMSSSSTPADPVLAKFLSGENVEIKDGQSFVHDESSNPVDCEKIEVEASNEFQDNGLRSGYLYLEYFADKDINLIFEASGHTMVLINGFPHEGDHYDFGWSLIPVHLKKGKNTFVLEGGRFPRMRARLLHPHKTISFTKRDLTLPDVLLEENEHVLGAIRIINVSKNWFRGGSIRCEIANQRSIINIPNISPMNVRKVPFEIPVPSNPTIGKITFSMQLMDARGKTIDTTTIELDVKSKYDHHKQTFLSDIDGSVQYYSIAPSSNKELKNPALFFSVHGASVEAVNQANAYKKKDWGHLIAPTNRRPFGFAWEDWGRLDALEVLNHAEKLLQTDPKHTYLTGHSMGGHGTWYLGATYPDKWAAIAPCAGYPDLLSYRESFTKRLKTMSDLEITRMGMTREQVDKMLTPSVLSQDEILLDSIIRRAGNPSRTLKLKRNYLHYGVYILHGEKDTVVPTFIAQDMRETLGKYHTDFTYYEYPNGSHWYGDHSVDWPPIFGFFKFRSIKPSEEIEKIEFYTASPGVSSGSHFIQILQQETPYEISSFNFHRDSISTITTENVETISIDLKEMGNISESIKIDEQEVRIENNSTELILKKDGTNWSISKNISASEKGPQRNGGFKDAFRNNMVFVYATKGTKEENSWYYHRALFDAEKFYYRGNGNVEIVKDTEFVPANYPDQNIVLYGNSDNNLAWKPLLNTCPIQVSKGELTIGNKTMTGDELGAYFIYPRKDSDIASIGVVTASGPNGMKAAYANHYLVNGTTFPDVLIFNADVLTKGISGVKCAGFFGNDWSMGKGDFVWKK